MERIKNKPLSDAARRPTIKNLLSPRNRYGVRQLVTVEVKRTFEVKEIKIRIVSFLGKFIEEGNAVQQNNPRIWLYETINRNQIIAGAKITATAFDYAGNSSVEEITLR